MSKSTTEEISLSAIKAAKKAGKTISKYTDVLTHGGSHKEGPVAKAIEKQTAKLPSDLFLWSAVSSMAVSAALQVSGKQKTSLFIGQWVAPLLLLGVYNKIVKVAGSDKKTKN